MENIETKPVQVEWSIMQCKGCNQTKKRFMDGRFANQKDVRWRDEDGGMWNGRNCPQCHREKVAQRKRNKSRLLSNA
jgi:hypothetical protein